MVDFSSSRQREKEDPAIIVRAEDPIRHLHMASPEGRVFPRRRTRCDYAPFFAAFGQSATTGVSAWKRRRRISRPRLPLAIAFLRTRFQ